MDTRWKVTNTRWKRKNTEISSSKGNEIEDPGIDYSPGENDHEDGTEERPINFLDLIPERKAEHIQEEWQIGFKVPRFRSRFWSWFFVHLGASEDYIVRLDRMGSEIWGHIDGEKNVRQILVRLELKHPDEEELRDRLVHYLKRLEFHEFIVLNEETDEDQEYVPPGYEEPPPMDSGSLPKSPPEDAVLSESDENDKPDILPESTIDEKEHDLQKSGE